MSTAPLLALRPAGTGVTPDPVLEAALRKLKARWVDATLLASPDPSVTYLLALDTLDDATAGRVRHAADAGARVALILRQANAQVLALASHPAVSVLPGAEDPRRLSERTLRESLRLVHRGERILARGFVEHAVPEGRTMPTGVHPFLDLVREASVQADGAPVVAAVLALHRTGSKFLRDLLAWTTSGAVRVLHEHALPARVPSGHSLAGTVGLGRALGAATHRYVFVTERDPVDRITSYFLRRQRDWLHGELRGDRFADAGAVQRAFDAFARERAEHQRLWYRTVLASRLGVGILETVPDPSGLFVARHGSTVLTVVPMSALQGTRAAVERVFGEGSTRQLDHNSAAGRGDQALAAIFRRDIHVDAGVASALRAMPEVAHLRQASR